VAKTYVENGDSASCKKSCKPLTPPRSRINRVQVIGNGQAEVKIYPIRRKSDRYRFFQIAWYELGGRRTKTLVDPLKDKSFAHDVHVSLLNQGRATEVTPQDIQMLRDAEAIAAKFGVSLPFAIREWADTREALRGTAMLPQAKSLADILGRASVFL
jgi:hypothetical protein